MLDSFGKRLKYCRFLIGLSTKDFVNELNKFNTSTNITYEAFSRWETDCVKFPSNSIIQLVVKLVKKLGLTSVTTEWLVYGEGFPPLPICLDRFNEDELTYVLLNILSDNSSFIIKTIVGNWAKPIALPGSHLIIKLTNNHLSSENLNKLMFYESIHQNFNIGVLTKIENNLHYCMKSNEGFFININEIKVAGRVVWIKCS